MITQRQHRSVSPCDNRRIKTSDHNLTPQNGHSMTKRSKSASSDRSAVYERLFEHSRTRHSKMDDIRKEIIATEVQNRFKPSICERSVKYAQSWRRKNALKFDSNTYNFDKNKSAFKTPTQNSLYIQSSKQGNDASSIDSDSCNSSKQPISQKLDGATSPGS